MKIAFALLPIAAALRFVEAGPFGAEDLVCASLFSSKNQMEFIISMLLDQACPRPSHKARL